MTEGSPLVSPDGEEWVDEMGRRETKEREEGGRGITRGRGEQGVIKVSK